MTGLRQVLDDRGFGSCAAGVVASHQSYWRTHPVERNPKGRTRDLTRWWFKNWFKFHPNPLGKSSNLTIRI